MQSILVHPAYFGPISQWVAMVQAQKLVFENEDNYQKQTYRNRLYLYDSNGKLSLNIPIKHSSSLGLDTNGRQKYKEVQIENDFDWQKQHWRAFKTAYQTSPFFEFYEDDLYPLFHTEYKYLMDFNYDCMQFVADCLQIELNFDKTDEYILKPRKIIDLRSLINAKSDKEFGLSAYAQVFEEKHGFLEDLCVLDLLFNEGNNSLNYLKEQKLELDLA
ncbi:hypothetical protein C7S20_12145 [Christiangramia fulva]|uniref:WbqC family protein n=1 Tax=Christiangramia fulva TaxID=2126553 RepID=A0A2R3Z6M4_9FLAO|nr:WbqC family protein [Christiangramia fulva]AVR45943.1 hypothetical protein C7S20_12145 [Christiangramia fulva]